VANQCNAPHKFGYGEKMTIGEPTLLTLTIYQMNNQKSFWLFNFGCSIGDALIRWEIPHCYTFHRSLTLSYMNQTGPKRGQGEHVFNIT